MTKIAVFGSVFNPPSLGHKSVIESLSHFDKILLVPSISHAWGKDMLDYPVRCQLVDAFIHDLRIHKPGGTDIERSEVESALYQPGKSVTTYAVLDYLQNEHPDAELTFVIGPDNLFNFAKFFRADEILRRWSVMACPERIPVRSTEIRERLNNRQSVDDLTTPSVAALITKLKLF